MSDEREQDGWLEQQAELWGQPAAQEASNNWSALYAQSARRYRYERLEYLGSQALIIASMGAVCWSVAQLWRGGHPLWMMGLALSYMPLGLYLGWRGRFFWRLKRDAHVIIAQSVQRLEAELEVSARELRWNQRIFPCLLAYVVVLALSVLLKAPNPITLWAGLLAALVNAAAAYVIYVRMPKSLRERAQRLAQLKADLEQ